MKSNHKTHSEKLQKYSIKKSWIETKLVSVLNQGKP